MKFTFLISGSKVSISMDFGNTASSNMASGNMAFGDIPFSDMISGERS